MCGFTRGHLLLAWFSSFYFLSLWRVGHVRIMAPNTTCALLRTRGAPILNHSPGSTSVQVNGYNTPVACGPFRHLTQHIYFSISPSNSIWGSGITFSCLVSLAWFHLEHFQSPPTSTLSPLLLGHRSFGLHLLFPCDDTSGVSQHLLLVLGTSPMDKVINQCTDCWYGLP